MVRIDDERTPTIVMVSPVPLIGYEVLENLRYRVNPVSQQLAKLPDSEIWPPFMLLGL